MSLFIAQMPEGQFRYQFGNPAHRLKLIGPEIFGSVPADGLKFLILYQRYESLGEEIAELETHWHPCCLTHNDLKLNNTLVHIEVLKQLPAEFPGQKIAIVWNGAPDHHGAKRQINCLSYRYPLRI